MRSTGYAWIGNTLDALGQPPRCPVSKPLDTPYFNPLNRNTPGSNRGIFLPTPGYVRFHLSPNRNINPFYHMTSGSIPYRHD